MGPPPASPPEVGVHNGFPSGIDCFVSEARLMLLLPLRISREGFSNDCLLHCLALKKKNFYRLKTDWAGLLLSNTANLIAIFPFDTATQSFFLFYLFILCSLCEGVTGGVTIFPCTGYGVVAWCILNIKLLTTSIREELIVKNEIACKKLNYF